MCPVLEPANTTELERNKIVANVKVFNIVTSTRIGRTRDLAFPSPPKRRATGLMTQLQTCSFYFKTFNRKHGAGSRGRFLKRLSVAAVPSGTSPARELVAPGARWGMKKPADRGGLSLRAFNR
jgi:hypothetical protein